MSDELLIRYCAPTLAGIKTGNMFSCGYQSRAEFLEDIRRRNRALRPKGLCLIPLHYSHATMRVLVYLYRPARLLHDLTEAESEALLKAAGYDVAHAEHHISRLVRRLRDSEDFPHEVGLFLGYPPEDVRGFIEHNAKESKCTGLWKVYGDEVQAKRLFAQYRRCTEVYYDQWRKGVGVERLAVLT